MRTPAQPALQKKSCFIPRGSEEARRYLAVYAVAPGKCSPEMLLFPDRTARAVTQQVRRLAKRVGWKTAKPGLHSLRATWCSELLCSRVSTTAHSLGRCARVVLHGGKRGPAARLLHRVKRGTPVRGSTSPAAQRR